MISYLLPTLTHFLTQPTLTPCLGGKVADFFPTMTNKNVNIVMRNKRSILKRVLLKHE
jgi:hypothetical protein